ncbi:hypothetical protein Tco_1350699 [Tanacetum coccineum]
MPTEPSGHAESPSLDVELALTDSETKSDEEVPPVNPEKNASYRELAKINTGDQDEGQAGPNPGKQDEGQAGSNPGKAAVFQAQSNHVFHVGPNLEHMDIEITDASTQQNPEQMGEEFTTTAYPNVQENLKLPTKDLVILEEPASSIGTLSSLQNLDKEINFTNQFFVEKPHEEEPKKNNIESEVQSMVTVPIYQDSSSVPPMTTPVIDLSVSHLVSTTVSKAVDEIVTDAVDWAMQALLPAQFSDLPAVDMKEILQQRMFEDKSYEAHEDHKNLFDALQKSLERDYSNQLLADLDEARKKKRKRRESPRTPPGSLPLQPPYPPPPAGASGAPAWTTSDTRYKSTGVSAGQDSSPIDSMMNDDSIPDEQVQLTDNVDTRNDHLPKADTRKDWWKPLPEEERPATPEPTWTIPSSNVSDVENNWATALFSTYATPAKNSLLAKTRDMMTFLNWYCCQMKECHKMLTDQVDWTNPKEDQVRIDVNQPPPLGVPLGHVTIHTQFVFNKDLEYLRYGNKGSRPALSISKMKAASYPDFGLELLVPEQMWIDDVCTYDISAKYGISHWWFNRQKFYIDRHDYPSRRKEVRTHMRFLSVVSIKVYSRYGYDYLREIVLRRGDFQEHTIAEKYFKNMYPNDFEDLNVLLLQGHLDHLPGFDKHMLSTAVKLWTRNLVI